MAAIFAINTYRVYFFNWEAEGRVVNGAAYLPCTVYILYRRERTENVTFLVIRKCLSLICWLGRNTRVHL